MIVSCVRGRSGAGAFGHNIHTPPVRGADIPTYFLKSGTTSHCFIK